MQVGLVGQRGREPAASLVDRLRERLRERGVDVLVDAATAEALDVDGVAATAMAGADLVVSVGGDGTFLYTARSAGPTPIIGVNLGEVGFLNAVRPDDAIEAVEAAVDQHADGELEVTELARLRATTPEFETDPAINEVLVQGPRRGAGARGTVTVAVDGEEYASDVADGVLVATPTGSTAYSMSEGGPLAHPRLDAIVLTPMFPAAGTRPLVVPGDATVEVTVEDAESGFVVGDGRQRHTVSPPTTVTVTRADEPLRVAGPGVEFFEALGKLE